MHLFTPMRPLLSKQFAMFSLVLTDAEINPQKQDFHASIYDWQQYFRYDSVFP